MADAIEIFTSSASERIEVVTSGAQGPKGDAGGATFDQDLNTTDAVAFASVNAPLYDAALNQPGAGVDDAVFSIYGADGTAKLDANGMTGLRVLTLPDESGTLALTANTATAAQGALADTAVQPNTGPSFTGIDVLADTPAVSVESNSSGKATAIKEDRLEFSASGNNYVHTLQRGTISADATFTLPTSTGTLALTSQIPSTFAASAITSGTMDAARLGTGTANSTSFLRGDQTWAVVSGVTTGAVDNAILRADGTGGSTSQGSDLVIDDATTSTQANVALRNNHSETNSALVLCNKGTGAFIVSPARPDGTSSGGSSRGSEAVCIVPSRNNANQVASGPQSVAIGYRARSSSTYTVAVGAANNSTGEFSTTLGHFCTASGTSSSIAIGRVAESFASDGIAIGRSNTASAVNATAIGSNSLTANLRAQFLTSPFSSVYWSGQTTNNTATILNLDGTATSRFTIAASTALAVDILLVARRATTQDKWLVARRFLGIRRDGSNNTSLIGAVQTLGTDQSAGSPTWTFALTADDTNEALQLEVTGATDETVEWRATAFYRVA